jgi:hypothetical protein
VLVAKREWLPVLSHDVVEKPVQPDLIPGH